MKSNTKELIITATVIFLLLIGIFYRLADTTGDFIAAVLLTAVFLALIISAGLYFKYEEGSSFKDQVLFICSFFILSSAYVFTLSRFISLNIFSLLFNVLLITLLLLAVNFWRHMQLRTLDKALLVFSLATFLGTYFYINALPRTAIELYRSELVNTVSYEDIKNQFLEDYREDFNRENFSAVESHLQKAPLRISQQAVLEFEDGNVILLDTAYGNISKSLQIKDIAILPEEIASYFRYYPLQIKREADSPANLDEDEGIIESRGAFISLATSSQSRDWYSDLLKVFGQVEIPEVILAPEGPVIGSGINNEGYLEICFDKDWELDAAVLDDIYELYQKEALKENISDIPIVFRHY